MLNITASDVKDAKLTATVTIPAADVDAIIKKAYKAAAKQYRFPGFRAGKAPVRSSTLLWRRGYPRSGHQRPTPPTSLPSSTSWTSSPPRTVTTRARPRQGSRGLHLHRRVHPAPVR